MSEKVKIDLIILGIFISILAGLLSYLYIKPNEKEEIKPTIKVEVNNNLSHWSLTDPPINEPYELTIEYHGLRKYYHGTLKHLDSIKCDVVKDIIKEYKEKMVIDSIIKDIEKIDYN